MEVVSFAAGQTSKITKSFEETFEQGTTAFVADNTTPEVGTVAADTAINTTLRPQFCLQLLLHWR